MDVNAGMDDLPTELLDEIFPYLNIEELLVVAQLSRRLHSLALPLFFSRHFIQDPSTLFRARIQCSNASHLILPTPEDLVPRRRGALSGLAIAFDVKQIDEFRCRFASCPNCSSGHRSRNYRRLIQVFKRLEKVRNISIVFDQPNQFDFDLGSGSANEERRGITMELLNLFVEKGCENLSIQNGCFPPPRLGSLESAVLPPTTGSSFRVANLFGSVRGLLGAPPTQMVQRAPGHAILLRESAREGTQLTHLEVSSLMLLTPPCWQWTRSIIETPPLTSLSLFQIQISTDAWKKILSWLVIPVQSQLLELSVVKCEELPTEEFVSFLLQLKAINYLKIIPPLPHIQHYRVPWTTRIILPALMGITAPPEWMTLLCPPSIPRPTLRYVNIAPGTFFGFGSRVEELNALLENTAFGNATATSASEDSVGQEIRMPQIVLDFAIFPRLVGSLRHNVRHYQDPANRKGCLAFERITHMTIHAVAVSDLLQNEKDCAIVTEFLGWWKGLWWVEFVAEYMAWEGRWTHQWNEDVIERLLKSARVLCPGIQVFVIQKKIYKVHD